MQRTIGEGFIEAVELRIFVFQDYVLMWVALSNFFVAYNVCVSIVVRASRAIATNALAFCDI